MITEDYQFRKDIDLLRKFLNDLEELYLSELGTTEGVTLKDIFDKYWDVSEIANATGKLHIATDKLDEDLERFKVSLIAFNQTLITFNGDTQTLASDLDTLSTNMEVFLSDLDGLSDVLDDLDVQLNGQTVNGVHQNGFVDDLDTLLNYMYGKGETNNGQPCSYSNPSSTSLKGMLDSLGEQLNELNDGDTQLAVTLSTLSTKLSGFSGTLNQFKTQIENEVGSSTYDALNTDLIELIYEIATSNTQIATHQQTIQTVQNTIGSTNDSTSANTVFGKINATSQVANQTSESATQLSNTIGSKTDSASADTVFGHINKTKSTIGSKTDNANTDTVYGSINKTKGDITGVQEDISDLDYQINNEDDGLLVQIGDEDSGIIKDIIDTQSAIGEVDDAINNFNTGLKKRTGTLETTVGDTNGGLVKQSNDNTAGIYNINIEVGKLLNPSTNFKCLFCAYTPPSNQDITNLKTYYGCDLNIGFWWRTSNNTFYYKSGNNWYPYNVSNINTTNDKWILVSQSTPQVSYQGIEFDYWFDPISKIYYHRYVDPSKSNLSGYHGEWRVASGTDFLGIIILYDAINNYFSTKNHTHNYANSSHTHTKSQITDFSHTHTKSEISDFSHTHDDRYYTETEIDTKLNGKANSSHTHTKSEISDFSHTHDDRYYTESEIDTKLSGKANSGHTHSISDVSGLQTALNNKMPSTWTSLYSGTYGDIKHNGSMVSCYLKSGSKIISDTTWTEMARMNGSDSLGISVTYLPPHNIFYQYLDGIVLKLDTNGVLSANRPSGQKSSSVEIYTMYAL